MAKKLLIAAVMVTCYVDGVRKDIPPGDPVPELSPHDEEQLKKMGAVFDPADELLEEKLDAKQAQAGDAEFQAARKAVIAADASLGDPQAGDANAGGEAPSGDSTQKVAAKKVAAKKASA